MSEEATAEVVKQTEPAVAEVVELRKDPNKEATEITKEEALTIQLNMERSVRLNSQVELSSLRANEAQRNLEECEKKRITFLKGVFAKYGIVENVDKLDTETCAITRAPKPKAPPAPAASEAEKKTS